MRNRRKARRNFRIINLNSTRTTKLNDSGEYVLTRNSDIIKAFYLKITGSFTTCRKKDIEADRNGQFLLYYKVESVKNEAGESLVHVKRKQKQITENMVILKLLNELREARKETAIYKGLYRKK